MKSALPSSPRLLSWLAALLTLCTADASVAEAAPASPEPPAERGRELVVDVNANSLLCAVASEHSFDVGMELPTGGVTTIQKSTPPTETLAVLGEQNDLQRRGRRYVLIRDGQWVGGVQLGVFEDPNSALKIFQDHLLHTSVGPSTDLSAELGTRAVAWSHGRGGQNLVRILFLRDNVVVLVRLNFLRFESLNELNRTLRELSTRIDGALASGSLGVQRGPGLSVPRITKVDVSGSPTSQTKRTARIHIAIPKNPRDKESEEVDLVRNVPVRVHSPGAGAEGKTSCHVVYISEGCVVASQSVDLGSTP